MLCFDPVLTVYVVFRFSLHSLQSSLGGTWMDSHTHACSHVRNQPRFFLDPIRPRVCTRMCVLFNLILTSKYMHMPVSLEMSKRICKCFFLLRVRSDKCLLISSSSSSSSSSSFCPMGNRDQNKCLKSRIFVMKMTCRCYIYCLKFKLNSAP